MENKQSDSDDPLKYCGGGSKESLITGENLDINTEDVILIFLEDENGEIKVAQCMLRQEIKTMYKQVNNKRDENRQLKGIRIKPDDTLVIKLPHIGVFVSNVEIIFQGDYSKDAVFIGKLLRPTDSQKEFTLRKVFHNQPYSSLSSEQKAVVDEKIYVESPFGIGSVHEPHFVYRIEPADPENPIVKEITAITKNRTLDEDDHSGTIIINDNTYEGVGLISKLREIQNQNVSTISISSYQSIKRIDYLPNTLTSLELYSLPELTSLPEVLPAGLTRLHLDDLPKLRSLPDLPAGLTTLKLSYLKLTSLPALPAGLTTLTLLSLHDLVTTISRPKHFVNVFSSGVTVV